MASGHIGGTKQKAIHAQEAVYLSQVAALSCSAFTRHVRSVAVDRSVCVASCDRQITEQEDGSWVIE